MKRLLCQECGKRKPQTGSVWCKECHGRVLQEGLERMFGKGSVKRTGEMRFLIGSPRKRTRRKKVE